MSSGTPRRLNGIICANCCGASWGMSSPTVPGVVMPPGATALTAMPVRGELERDVLREPPEAVPGGVVVREPDHRRVQRVDRRDVDDAPALALLDHLRRHGEPCCKGGVRWRT